MENKIELKFHTCVAVSPSSLRLCALRDRDNDGPNFEVELRSNSKAAARFLSSTTNKIIQKITFYERKFYKVQLLTELVQRYFINFV